MKPIYIPSGRAGEYGDYAINIYTGCPHRCYYCFGPQVVHKEREIFHSDVKPRPGIIEALTAQLERGDIKGKLIHLCFTCDPYPLGVSDTTITREAIQLIKESGNHVQILTKGGYQAQCDFDLLDSNDRFGVTVTATHHSRASDEPCAAGWMDRLSTLKTAKSQGVGTWVSCEPVLHAGDILELIRRADYIDLFKIGKLNYWPSDINWAAFGRQAEAECIAHGREYYIKADLRKEMEAAK